ncbi:MAG: NAD-dependent epimerase/dehydratase family protein [Caldilinea sp.]|nr:NAD-dependent epimerase/dehydratase family protein [Caldilinea sp.]
MENRERIIVLGGDGFCGWPTSLRLSSEGYDVVIVDNLSRRKIDVELGCESLTPIKPLEQRLRRWEEISGRRIDYRALNIADDYEALEQLIQEVRPKAIVHFAEQRAAPYSMKSPRHKRYTVDNNINGTHNILCAIVESGLDIHLVHLGTMGVYGYGTAGMSIPEGYLTVKVDIDGVDREIEIPYPPHPGSIYHMTKTLDALLFYYYNKNDDIRITDLHQGVVWGTNTEETLMHPDLINRFDWEGDYGTVLNRFLVEAAVGHPLTVYGSGGQARVHPHPRYRALHLTRHQASAGQEAARQDLQPGHGDAPRARPGGVGGPADRRRGALLRQPAQRGLGERVGRSQRAIPRTGAESHHAERRAAARSDRDCIALCRPRRPGEDHRRLALARRHPAGSRGNCRPARAGSGLNVRHAAVEFHRPFPGAG